MRFDSYEQMISAFWALYRSEAWEDALDLLTREGDAFPDKEDPVAIPEEVGKVAVAAAMTRGDGSGSAPISPLASQVLAAP